MGDVHLPIQHIHGRGAAANPPNRFERQRYERDPDDPEHTDESESPGPQTELIADDAKSIIRRNESPDLPFNYSLNTYRGCEHGCVYCYARPTHETLGYSAGLDFETRILVKHRAAELLRRELMAPSWKGDVINISTVTDCYQPVERKLGITRQCLAVLAEFRNPVVIVSKNHLVTRDVDLLAELAGHQAALVWISLTTLRPDLTAIMEPRTSSPARRLAAIKALAQAGVPVGVLAAPVIPGLTDEELPAILSAAAAAGARFAGYTPVRLPYGVKDLFINWLEQHMPNRAEKVINRIREVRGGRLNDSNFYSRMSGEGIFMQQIAGLFGVACRKAGLSETVQRPSSAAFRRPGGQQLSLFDSQ